MTKRAVLYARVSVSAEESVSIDRQLESGRQYAQARGWTVVGEFIDDGVSATHVTPARRKGWTALLGSETTFDTAIAWKVDRVARRVGDFDAAISDLRARGAVFVSVEESLDMSTPTGEAMANIIVTFARLEAATTSQRVRAARTYLATDQPARFAATGRPAPYGYRLADNPDGAGKVLVADPIEWPFLADAAAMVLDGHTVYAACQMLDTMGAPLPRERQGSWSHTSLERMLRNPIVGGMTAHNPGRDRNDNLRHSRDTLVLRDGNGLPVVNAVVAILTPEEHRTLVGCLDGKTSPAARPRASREATSPLLSRLVECGACAEGGFMSRGSLRSRPVLKCTTCYQTISRGQLDPHIVARLLDERGAETVVEWTDETEDHGDLVEIEHAISQTTQELAADGADEIALLTRLKSLKALRSDARAPHIRRTLRWTDRTVSEVWAACEDDTARREVLAGQVESIRVVRGNVGRNLDPMRVQITWKPEPEEIETSLRKIADLADLVP